MNTEQNSATELAGNDDFDAYMEEGFSDGAIKAPTSQTPDHETAIVEPHPIADEHPHDPTSTEPKMRQITEDEYTKLMSSAAAIDEMKATFGKQVDTAFGKIGGIERFLKQLQDDTPNGKAVEITEDDLAEIKEEFPELLGPQLKALQRIAGKMRGTGGGVDDDRIREVVKPSLASISDYAVERAKAEIASELLDDDHPGWRDTVGLPEDGKIPDTEFRRWAATLPAERQQQLFNSYSPRVIGKALTEFGEYQKKLKSANERRNRFSDAVTPKGDAGTRSAPVDDEDAGFAEGFASR